MSHHKKIVNLLLACTIISFLFLFWLGYSGTAGKLTTESLGPNQFTFGNTVAGDHGWPNQNDANSKSASSFTCPTTGTVSTITALSINRANSNGYGMAAIYYGPISSYASLLGQSNEAYISTSTSDITFTLTSPVAVTAGQTYTLAVMSDDQLDLSDNPGTGERAINGNNYANGFSNPFGYVWGSDQEGAMSIFAFGTTTSTPTATPTVTPTPTPYIYNPNPTPTPTASPASTNNPTSTPTATPSPAPTLAPWETASPTPNATPIQDVENAPDRTNEFCGSFGLGGALTTGMVMILYNPETFGRKKW